MRKYFIAFIMMFMAISANAQFSARYSKLHLGNPGVDFKLISNKSQAQIAGGGTFTIARPDDFTKDEVMALYKYFEEHKEEIEKKYNVIIVRNNLNQVLYQYGNVARPEIVIFDRDAKQKYDKEYTFQVKDGKEEAKAKIESLFNK